MIIDSHVHLFSYSLIDRQKEIIESLKANRIDKIIEIGIDLETSINAAKLARENERVYASVGVHPSEASENTKEIYSKLKELSYDSKVVAIGEIGLDYHYDKPSREVQRKVFIDQIKLADELNLPIIVHMRDAFQDTLNILNEYQHMIKNGILFHCYSGSKEFVKEVEKFDPYFAFGGVITFSNAKKDDIIKSIVIDRLIIETDSPYLTPHPFRGKINEPKNVVYVLNKMADILNMDKKELEDILWENTHRLFPKLDNKNA